MFTNFTGKRLIGADGNETTNDMYHENTMLSKENSNLRTRIKAMQETIDHLTAKNSQLLAGLFIFFVYFCLVCLHFCLHFLFTSRQGIRRLDQGCFQCRQ